MNRETKQESSIPAQCRVSIVTLAQLTAYWKDNGYDIRTVSQLMSWSLDLLKDILSNNKQIGIDPSIGEAVNYMIREKLYQKGTFDRGHKKLEAAIRFEGMRAEGNNPGKNSYTNPTDRMAYSTMHRAPNRFTGVSSSVEPFMGKVSNPTVTQEMIDTYNNMKPEDIKPLISQEFAMRNVELQPLKQSDDMSDRFRDIEKADKANMDELNNFDPMSLLNKAKKE